MLATDRYTLPWPQQDRERDDIVRILLETVERLAERVDVLEARASLVEARERALG